MLAHLGKDCADVQMDVTWIRNITEVQVVVLNLKGLFKIAQCTPKLLSSSKNTCKIVVRHSSESVTLFGERLSLSQKLE